MTQSVSLGVHPAHEQADGQGGPGTDVEQDGSPVQPLLSIPLRFGQFLFHLLDPLRGAGDPLLTVSLSHAGKRKKESDQQSANSVKSHQAHTQWH